MSYANMDGVPTQTAGTSELLASDWNTYVRDNFDSIKFGHIVCTSSTRPTGIAEGTMIYETDTDKVLVYSGSAWLAVHNTISGSATSVVGRSANSSGERADIAASADGQVLRRASGSLGFGDVPAANVTSLGLTHIATVSPSAVTSIDINTCFSSTYDNYLILASLVCSSSNNMHIRMRNAGTTDTGSNYTFGYVQQDSGGTSVSAGRADTNVIVLGSAGSTDPNLFVINIFAPALAKRTMVHCSLANSNSNLTVQNFGGSHRVASAYDSINFLTNAAPTMTGTIRVYGYKNS